ncbi:MAG: hypothetical protein H6R43_172 [Nitrospirae bacterium]|nr:hypothetical protein [Nitrospirota bacterium]
MQEYSVRRVELKGSVRERMGKERMTKAFATAILAGFILMAPLLAAGENATVSVFRCEPYVISLEMTQSEVRKKCGEPANVETWEEERIKRDFYEHIPVQTQEELSQLPLFVKELITIEEAEYNFGPTRFMYYLRFENSILRRITVGNYGYYSWAE